MKKHEIPNKLFNTQQKEKQSWRIREKYNMLVYACKDKTAQGEHMRSQGAKEPRKSASTWLSPIALLL